MTSLISAPPWNWYGETPLKTDRPETQSGVLPVKIYQKQKKKQTKNINNNNEMDDSSA